MKISFVIPAYNEEHYIGDCLKAIIEQKRELVAHPGNLNLKPDDIEIVVVDNASTDRTSAVVASYPDVKLVHETRKGILWARRAGLLAATGDLIANVDADTRITPGWLRKVLTAFATDPKLVGYSGPFIYYDAPLSLRILTRVFNTLGYVFYLIIRFIFRSGSLLQGGNYVVRRDALEKIGGYDTRIEFYGEDTDVARRLNSVGKVIFTFRLPALSSGRRLAKEGVFTMGIRYATNILWITFFKHPYHNQSTDVRFDSDVATFHAEHPAKEWAFRVATILAFLAIFAILGGAGYAAYHFFMLR